MRRPTLCCDQQSTAVQSGALFARMRRFLTPLGRRSSGLSAHQQQCLHHHGGPQQQEVLSSSTRPVPPLKLTYSFGLVQQEIIGVPLDEVLKGWDNAQHGIPLLVYDLCTYILNNDVNCSSILFEEWCSEEVVSALTHRPRCRSLEPGAAAPLLRHYCEELPQPLLPPHTLTALMAYAEAGTGRVVVEEVVECRARRLLVRDLPPHNLRMLGYLTTFLCCLHQTNRCSGEDGGQWVLLSAALVGAGPDRRAVGKLLAQYLLLHCHALFPEYGEAFPAAAAAALLLTAHHRNRDVSSTGLTSQDDDSETAGSGATTNDDEEDDDSSSTSSSSRSSSRSSPRTTTSEDTEDFRSPQLSPTTGCGGGCGVVSKLPVDRYVLLSEDVIMTPEGNVVSPEEDVSGGGGGGGGGGGSGDLVLGGSCVDDVTSGSVGGISGDVVLPPDDVVILPEECVITSNDLPLRSDAGLVLAPSSDSLKFSEPDSSRGDRHGTSSCTSNNGDLAKVPLSFLCDIKGETRELAWEKRSTGSSAGTDTPLEESDGGGSTSCHLSDPWDYTSNLRGGGGGGVSSEDAAVFSLQDDGTVLGGGGELYLEGKSRFSEKSYPLRGGADPSSSSCSPQHRSKRKKSKHRRHSKEGGLLWSSNEGKLPLSQTQSEEEDNTLHEAADSATDNKDSLSSLLDYNEPAVTCDRGRWLADRHDTDHRTAHTYSRYDDDGGRDDVSPWYKFTSSPVVSSTTDDQLTYDPGLSYEPHRFDNNKPSATDDVVSSSSAFASDVVPSSAFMKAVTGKSSASSSAHKNVSSIKKRIKRFEEDFENKFGYKPSHSDKMKHKEVKKYMSDLSKARKELKLMKEGVADLVSSRGFSLSLLRCQESTQNHIPSTTTTTTTTDQHQQHVEPTASINSTQAPLDHKSTLGKVEDKLRDSRDQEGRPQELSQMNTTEMQDEKTSLQKALLYYESVHGRPNTRDARELARPLYDRYRQVKRSVSRTQARAKENINELAPIIEHVAMDFTLASPQHRSSLIPDTPPVEQLLQCKEKLLAVARKQQQQQQLQQQHMLGRQDSDDYEDSEDDSSEKGQGSLSDSSDVSKQSSTALSNLHSLPLHELKERRREARDHKKKLRKSLRQFEERYEREHGHKLAKEDRGKMEQTYLEYKHAKAKLRLLEALISKKAPKDDEF